MQPWSLLLFFITFFCRVKKIPSWCGKKPAEFCANFYNFYDTRCAKKKKRKRKRNNCQINLKKFTRFIRKETAGIEVPKRTSELVSSVSCSMSRFHAPLFFRHPSAALELVSPAGFLPAFVPSSNQTMLLFLHAWSVNNRPCDRKINSFFHHGARDPFRGGPTGMNITSTSVKRWIRHTMPLTWLAVLVFHFRRGTCYLFLFPFFFFLFFEEKIFIK